MVTLSFYVLTFSFLNVVFGNDLLFAKFYQSDYKLKDFRAEVKSFNREVYDNFEMKTFKFNRSVAALNITLKTKMNVDGKNLDILVQAYKFASNEYRVFPVHFQVNLFQGLSANVGGLKSIFGCGNISMNPFYFKRGVTYRTCDIVPQESRLPPLMPVGRYMIEFQMFGKNKITHS